MKASILRGERRSALLCILHNFWYFVFIFMIVSFLSFVRISLTLWVAVMRHWREKKNHNLYLITSLANEMRIPLCSVCFIIDKSTFKSLRYDSICHVTILLLQRYFLHKIKCWTKNICTVSSIHDNFIIKIDNFKKVLRYYKNNYLI